MSDQPDVIVVGGGIVGTAIQYELARRSIPSMLFERGRVGRGDTGRSAAIVRMHYTNPPVVRMALRSREIFRDWAGEVGGPPVFTAAGWLFLVPPDEVETAVRNVTMQRAEGVIVDRLDPADLASLVPGVSTDGVAAAYLEPGSGYADPIAAAVGYASASAVRGATVREGVSVDRLVRDGGRVVGVATTEGEVRAGTVVLAAGPGSIGLARSVGLELPITCTREQELLLEVASDRAQRPSISSVVDRFYGRPVPGHQAVRQDRSAVLVGRGFPKPYESVEPEAYATGIDASFEAELRDRIRGRLPELADGPLLAGTVGLYDVTPDWHPILGPVPGLPGLMLATGGSGHCFKLGPAIGEMLAAAIAGTPVDYADVAAFSIERFATGRVFGSTYGGNRA